MEWITSIHQCSMVFRLRRGVHRAAQIGLLAILVTIFLAACDDEPQPESPTLPDQALEPTAPPIIYPGTNDDPRADSGSYGDPCANTRSYGHTLTFSDINSHGNTHAIACSDSMATYTLTSTPTATHTPSPTATPTLTATPTPTATHTPHQKIAGSERFIAQVQEALQLLAELSMAV